MINVKRAILILPLYVAAMLVIDAIFHSSHLNASKSVPVWEVVGFIASALAVVAIVIWYVARRASGKIPQKREHAYIALLVGVIVSGFVGDTLGGLVGLFLGGKSIWIMAPSYVIAYGALLLALEFTLRALNRSTGEVDDRSGSSH